MKNKKIIIDTLGADMPPTEICEGIKLNNNKNYHYVVVGPKEEIQKVLNNSDLSYEVIDTADYISNKENPINIIRNRESSSLYLSLINAKKEDAIGLISAGSTGAIMVGSMFILGLEEHLQSAVLACILYKFDNKPFCLVDCGANVNPLPSDMKVFAELGSRFMHSYSNIENPKVGLLSVGKEKGKGNELVKKAYEILENSDLNFIGNIEIDNVFNSDVDVLVCDGFSGNLLLKNTESVALMISNKIAKEYCTNENDLKKISDSIFKLFSYNDQAGAILLGVKKIVVKVHGKANRLTISSAINQLIALNDGGYNNK